ncbi:MAG: hypothetical protein H8D23_03285 [Candidatus Brocadiales bacterium]|nr:hypothetical protein [Candidatus Brocadiales bacterium]
MDNLDQVYYLAMESVSLLDNDEMGEQLAKVGSRNQKDFPKSVYEFAAKPVPLVEGAHVERYTLNISGAQTAFVDIHEIEETLIYIKIFFLFGIQQFIKTSSYDKKIDNLMHKNNGPPDMQASFKLRQFIGPKCLVYNPGDAVVITNNTIEMAQKEFQIHVYDFSLFDVLFPQAFY